MNNFVSLGQEILKLLQKNLPQYLIGAQKTLDLAVIATFIGCIIGLLCGILQTIPCSKKDNIIKRGAIYALRGIIRAYVEIFRGTPMILQAVFIYFAIPYFGGPNLDPIFAAYLVVSINTGAYMAEIVRGGIISIDKGQFEGAYSVGMTHWQTMIHVIIPQVMRNILPSISNEFVINIKDTSVLNVIGVMELYYMAGKIQSMTWQIFETYLIICVMYFIMTFTVTRLLRLAEKKLEGGKNYTICGSQSDPAAEIHISEEAKQ